MEYDKDTIEELRVDIIEEQKLRKSIQALIANEPIVYTTKTLTDREIKDEMIKLNSK